MIMVSDKVEGIPAAPDDDWQRRLRESLRRRRPRRTRVLLGFILLMAAVFGLLIWAFYPEAEPPFVISTAFDDLAAAGTEVLVQGCLEAPLEPRTAFAGRDVVFADGQGP